MTSYNFWSVLRSALTRTVQDSSAPPTSPENVNVQHRMVQKTSVMLQLMLNSSCSHPPTNNQYTMQCWIGYYLWFLRRR